MAVNISGMFGNGNTYFSGSPVVIDINGLEWPVDSSGNPTSPFNIVRVHIIYRGRKTGDFHADTGGRTSFSFDISDALIAIWAGEDFANEVAGANTAVAGTTSVSQARAFREYSIRVVTEYINTNGRLVTTDSGTFDGGKCAIGKLTEWERSNISSKEDADVSYLNGLNKRNGDASTKPTETPERVGRDSITSWVDFSVNGTQSVFYPAGAADGEGTADSTDPHAPLVLRDSQSYTDFLFVNRRGGVETCSACTKESMSISAESKQYNRVERPSFSPTRSLMAVAEEGRRSWAMSSGYQTREWAVWWATEFLTARQCWMRYKYVDITGYQRERFVPVVVKPAKTSVGIYDLAKQNMPHVDFDVTLAFSG